MNYVPEAMFFTRGLGVHKDQLASFELALRQAGIERSNLVYVSSILPPKCKIISPSVGIKLLEPGQITFCVMAKQQTNEQGRRISASIGSAVPKDNSHYGYLSEHHAYGETEKISGDYAEDLAATMLATTLGVEFDPDKAWREREQIYKSSGLIFKTTHICKSSMCPGGNVWSTVVAAGVFIMDYKK